MLRLVSSFSSRPGDLSLSLPVKLACYLLAQLVALSLVDCAQTCGAFRLNQTFLFPMLQFRQKVEGITKRLCWRFIRISSACRAMRGVRRKRRAADAAYSPLFGLRRRRHKNSARTLRNSG